MLAHSPKQQAFKPTNSGFYFSWDQCPSAVKKISCSRRVSRFSRTRTISSRFCGTPPPEIRVNRLLFHSHRTAGRLLVGVMGFVGEHPVFRPAAATAFLAANFFDLGALRGHVAAFHGFHLVQQQAAGDEAVESLLAGLQARSLSKFEVATNCHADSFHYAPTMTPFHIP